MNAGSVICVRGKTISADSFIELLEHVLKNRIFEHSTSFYKQLRRAAIGTEIALLYVNYLWETRKK